MWKLRKVVVPGTAVITAAGVETREGVVPGAGVETKEGCCTRYYCCNWCWC